MQDNLPQLPDLVRWAARNHIGFVIVTHMLPYSKAAAGAVAFDSSTDRARQIFRRVAGPGGGRRGGPGQLPRGVPQVPAHSAGGARHRLRPEDGRRCVGAGRLAQPREAAPLRRVDAPARRGDLRTGEGDRAARRGSTSSSPPPRPRRSGGASSSRTAAASSPGTATSTPAISSGTATARTSRAS